MKKGYYKRDFQERAGWLPNWSKNGLRQQEKETGLGLFLGLGGGAWVHRKELAWERREPPAFFSAHPDGEKGERQ